MKKTLQELEIGDFIFVGRLTKINSAQYRQELFIGIHPIISKRIKKNGAIEYIFFDDAAWFRDVKRNSYVVSKPYFHKQIKTIKGTGLAYGTNIITVYNILKNWAIDIDKTKISLGIGWSPWNFHKVSTENFHQTLKMFNQFSNKNELAQGLIGKSKPSVAECQHYIDQMSKKVVRNRMPTVLSLFRHIDLFDSSKTYMASKRR